MFFKVGTVHDIKLAHILSPIDYYVHLLSPTHHSFQSKLLSLTSFQPKDVWSSFLPAFPSRLVLARSCGASSWQRAKIVNTDEFMATVTLNFIDWGHTEVVSDPSCLSDLPSWLDFCPLALVVRLDTPQPQEENGEQVRNTVLERASIEDAEWKLLVKFIAEESVLVEIFLSSSCGSRKTVQLSTLLFGGLAGRSNPQETDKLSNWPRLSGHRLPVTVSQQPLCSPSSLLVSVDEASQLIQSGLALCDQGDLTRLEEGGLLAVRVSSHWQRARLLQAGIFATVLLVDIDKQVQVEYKDCRNLPASLHHLPIPSVRVQIVGLHADWLEDRCSRLEHILHLHTTHLHTPKLFIIVHSMNSKVWEVSLVEEVSRSHQVNIGALLVAEGLAKCLYKDQMRVVLGWGEAREGDTGPWLKESDRLINIKKEDIKIFKREEELENPSREVTVDNSCDSDLDSLDSCHINDENLAINAMIRIEEDDLLLARCGNHVYSLLSTPDRVKAESSLTTSPDSGVGLGEDSSSHLFIPDENLPDSFSGIITNIEMEAGEVWLVPSCKKAKHKLVNTLLASINRRLPAPGTRREDSEQEMPVAAGDDVLAWWEAETDLGWHRARVLDTHRDLSTTVMFIDWGNTEHLPAGQVVLPNCSLSGFGTLAMMPGLASKAKLYGVQMEMLEDKTSMFHLMTRVQTAAGRWDNQAQFTVCHRQPLHCLVQYQDNRLHFNLTGVLVAGQLACIKVPPVPSCYSPSPSPLPWQCNLSWPGLVTWVEGDQAWVVPVPLSPNYGLSDTDWYLDSSVQLLDRLHSRLDSLLEAAHHSGDRLCSSPSPGQTVILCDRGENVKYYRGVVRGQTQSTKLTIFLPDSGRVETVDESSVVFCPAKLCVWPARAVSVKLASSGAVELARRKEGVVLVTVLRGDMTAHIRSAGDR